MQSQVAEDNGEFAIEDVIDGIARKMIHRHPHVFAGRHYDSVEQQQADWEKLKSQEEGHKQTSLKEEITLVPESFPALIRGQKIAKKAASAGMFSTEDEDVFKDLLTSVVNLPLGKIQRKNSAVMRNCQRSWGKFSLHYVGSVRSIRFQGKWHC